MDIRKLDHSALVVSDMERARWFYGTVLGLSEVPRPSNFTFSGAWFRGDGFEIHLILAADTPAQVGFGNAGPASSYGLAHHLGFEVADLAAAAAQLHKHGVPIAGGPLPRGDGPVQLYFYDPDGNYIELFQWGYTQELPIEERTALR